jgi:excisionase family DNA binding protein
MKTITILLGEDLSRQLTQEIRSVVSSEISKFLKRYEKPWLTVREVAEMLNLSEKTIQNYRSQGKIAYTRLDRKVYISRKELDRFMLSHQSYGGGKI